MHDCSRPLLLICDYLQLFSNISTFELRFSTLNFDDLLRPNLLTHHHEIFTTTTSRLYLPSPQIATLGGDGKGEIPQKLLFFRKTTLVFFLSSGGKASPWDHKNLTEDSSMSDLQILKISCLYSNRKWCFIATENASSNRQLRANITREPTNELSSYPVNLFISVSSSS